MGSLIERKKRILLNCDPELPPFFERLPSAVSYACNVDLEYVPTVKPRAIITMELNEAIDRDIMGFLVNTAPSFIINPSPMRWYNRYGGTSSLNLSVSPSHNVKQVWEFGETVKRDGVVVNTFTYTGGWSSNAQSFHLCGARTNYSVMTIYDFKLFDGDECVRNLIPCVRSSDSTIGFWDTISKKFYTTTVGHFTR